MKVLAAAVPDDCIAALRERAAPHIVVEAVTDPAAAAAVWAGGRGGVSAVVVGSAHDDPHWAPVYQGAPGEVLRVLYHGPTSLDAAARDAAMRPPPDGTGVHMVTHSVDAVAAAVAIADPTPDGTPGDANCPVCPARGLNPEQLWRHTQLLHSTVPPQRGECPLCNGWQKDLGGHLYKAHAPPAVPRDKSRSGLPLYSFALCVIRRPSDGKFLLVQERAEMGYWLPGGGIDPGEHPVVAARREAVEEVGVEVDITGVLRVEISPSPHHVRTRYILYGAPKDPAAVVKTVPDGESAGAVWVAAEDLPRLRLRGEEPEWCAYVARGGAVHPLAVLATERTPIPS